MPFDSLVLAVVSLLLTILADPSHFEAQRKRLSTRLGLGWPGQPPGAIGLEVNDLGTFHTREMVMGLHVCVKPKPLVAHANN
jgi:hypothetical protein